MKKLLTTTLFMGALVSVSTAQVKLGVKLNPQLTWAATDSKSATASGTNLNLSYGLMLDYYFTDYYAFATELCITNMSGSLHVPGVQVSRNNSAPEPSDVDYDYSLRYFSIPALIKMRTAEIGYFRYYAEFGMDFGFRMRAKADIKSSTFTLKEVDVNNPDPVDEYVIQTDETTPQKLSDDVKFIRTGLVIGAGLQYKIFGNTLLNAGLRFENRLNDFTSEKSWKAGINMVGLQFGFLF